MTNQMLSVEAG